MIRIGSHHGSRGGLTISDAGGCDTRDTGPRPARRAELAAVCLVQESCSRRREDAEEDAKEKNNDANLKSNNPNTEGEELRAENKVRKNE